MIFTVACFLSGLAVVLIGTVGGIELSHTEGLIICCLLTVTIGGIAMAWEAAYYIRPAEDVVKAAAKVMNRDFSVQIPASEHFIVIKEGQCLTECFNHMVKELAGLDKMQCDFINNVSHEFKTPLSAVAGMTEILIDDSLGDEERREYIDLVHKEALRLSRLSDNLLRLSRLDNQDLKIKCEPVDLDEQVRKCLIMLLEKYIDKGQELSIELPALTIESNPDMTWQIWLNLLDNAMKYSPMDTTIYVWGQISGDKAVVHIRDEGKGIPLEKQEHIFDRFYQCEESHKEQGSGLGLAIVQGMLHWLGGSIECRSTEGRGTEMIVTLPEKYGKVDVLDDQNKE
ncbi:HAMP domain-containing sensor histidine kinase [Anaerovibrio sp.]|uniref:sensor histidine kinase n=1 Tax=Anaerovibrio sp. TaxID=1872532 RepID=UPI0025E63F1B|nr:HAMP domain-containing sensor histidine kinase [Anaerovibrio sp.]